LMRENGWSADFTRRALAEYRRFLFLCMSAEHPVCPSEAVDQVWHLHLIYTRSYWDDLCGRVLGKPLHHGPTRGGHDEGVKHHDMYTQTLDSYRQFFAEEPPQNIWPPMDERFRDGASFTRVNRREFWMIRKPRWLGAAALLVPWLLTGCEVTGSGPLNYSGPDFLMFFTLFCAGVLLVIAGMKASARGSALRKTDDAVLSDPYLAAMLSGGDSLVVTAALSELSRRGLLSIAARMAVSRIPGTVPDGTLHPLEAAIIERMPDSVASPREIAATIGPELRAMRERLEQAGLVVPLAAQARLRSRIAFFVALIPIIGVVKMGIGLDRGKPVLFLLILPILGTLIAYAMRKVPFRTNAGEEGIRKLREQYAEDAGPLTELGSPSLPAGALPLALAIFGTSVLAGTPYGAFAPPPGRMPDNSSSGCSGGCSGGDSGGGSDGGGSSGCSSGCGGCGGGGGD
jgi:uncharacterized protein (TIGR04222 family)